MSGAPPDQRSSMSRLPASTKKLTSAISGSKHASSAARRVLPTRTHTTGGASPPRAVHLPSPLGGGTLNLLPYGAHVRFYLRQQVFPPGCLLLVGAGEVKIACVLQDRTVFSG